MFPINERQSGLSNSTELVSRGGSVRVIQQRRDAAPAPFSSSAAAAAAASASAASGPVPAASAAAADAGTRFPKLEECAHFHYDVVDLGSLAVSRSIYQKNE